VAEEEIEGIIAFAVLLYTLVSSVQLAILIQILFKLTDIKGKLK
jgi:hypothetical protein